MEKSTEKRTRHGSKQYASYTEVIKRPQTVSHGKGRQGSGKRASIPEEKLGLSMQREYEQMFDFKFPSYQMGLSDYFDAT